MSKLRPGRWSRRYERGSASIQLVILLPALFGILFLGMQAALYHHARTVAIAAAQEGARAAAAEHGTATNGVRDAKSFIAEAGGNDVLPHSSASASRTPTTVTVTVTGRSLSVIPGWNPLIRQSASAPIEQVTAP
ncbi:TadE/TadG family type IV pilus assembly protein [Nocardioides sambongensis]|uniref:TadE/TadG family type IV pilus assembly protein n=1 Tax=Nocardioides sambongensis TaxID=2589074 RepID=UPI001129CD23|nr:TadE/TadG family type IV pilus assembly protein [Nocardioides sambongensis]